MYSAYFLTPQKKTGQNPELLCTAGSGVRPNPPGRNATQSESAGPKRSPKRIPRAAQSEPPGPKPRAKGAHSESPGPKRSPKRIPRAETQPKANPRAETQPTVNPQGQNLGPNGTQSECPGREPSAGARSMRKICDSASPYWRGAVGATGGRGFVGRGFGDHLWREMWVGPGPNPQILRRRLTFGTNT